MSSKKRKYVKKSFESDTTNNDISANIYSSMILSKVWQDLSAKQQTLYLHCKLQYYGQSGRRAVDPNDNTKFYFNRALWCDTYKLYSRGNQNGFYKDMNILIEYGFINKIESGRVTRTKSIYQYSNKWREYESNPNT